MPLPKEENLDEALVVTNRKITEIKKKIQLSGMEQAMKIISFSESSSFMKLLSTQIARQLDDQP